MTDAVPSWHDPTGGSDSGTTGWSPPGQARPQAPAPGATGQSTTIVQLEQRLFDELDRAKAALAQVQAQAQAARDDAQGARAQARDAHEAAEALLAKVSARGDAGSGTAPHDDPAPAPPVPAGPRAGDDDPLAGALAAFAADLQAAADARARGEIDARQALRLARSGFHKAHRVITRVGREELRAGR